MWYVHDNYYSTTTTWAQLLCLENGIVIMAYGIMAYGSTPYAGMTLKKNGGHIKSAQMTRLKRLR